MLPLHLMTLILIPLDIAPQGPREQTPIGMLALLLLVLVALVTMVGVLFWIRRKKKS